MPPTRPKPPKRTREEIATAVRYALGAKFEHPAGAVDYLLKFFTAVDLEGIEKDLASNEET